MHSVYILHCAVEFHVERFRTRNGSCVESVSAQRIQRCENVPLTFCTHNPNTAITVLREEFRSRFLLYNMHDGKLVARGRLGYSLHLIYGVVQIGNQL